MAKGVSVEDEIAIGCIVYCIWMTNNTSKSFLMKLKSLHKHGNWISHQDSVEAFIKYANTKVAYSEN